MFNKLNFVIEASTNAMRFGLLSFFMLCVISVLSKSSQNHLSEMLTSCIFCPRGHAPGFNALVELGCACVTVSVIEKNKSHGNGLWMHMKKHQRTKHKEGKNQKDRSGAASPFIEAALS